MELFDKLILKHLSGEELTEEEEKKLRMRNFRYELVRFLVMEKLNYDTKGTDRQLTSFHFTPGPKWEEIPIVDFVNSLLKVRDMDVVDVNGEPNPLYKSHEAPHTGKEKKKLL